MILAGIGFYSCDDITKGYLEMGEAAYVTDTLFITLQPGSADSIPYQSEEIQGIIGTFPIYYEIVAVKDGEGKAVDAAVASQVEMVRKAVVQIAKNHTIPAGTYTIDLRVWNLGRSFTLEGVYTVVVAEGDIPLEELSGKSVILYP